MSEWHQGKTQGCIFQRANTLYVTASLGSKSHSGHITKNFYGEQATQKADEWRKETSDRLYFTKNSYKIVGDIVIMQLSKGYAGLFDLEDLPLLTARPLCCGGDSSSGVYANTHQGPLHRLLMNLTDSAMVVDHINRCTLDNRKENLRVVTHRDNLLLNAAKRNGSPSYDPDGAPLPYGVSFDLFLKMYHVFVHQNGGGTANARFSTREDALRWYNIKREEYGNTTSFEPLPEQHRFEALMREHCADIPWLKWSYPDPDSHRKDLLRKQTKRTARLTPYEQVYMKFRGVCPEFGTRHIPESNDSRMVHLLHLETSEEHKYCGHCQVWKQLGNFTKCQANWDSLSRWCRECESVTRVKKTPMTAAWIEIYRKFSKINPYFTDDDLPSVKGNRIAHLCYEATEWKYCCRCETWKKTVAFYKCKSRWDGLAQQCQQCTQQSNKTRWKKRCAATRTESHVSIYRQFEQICPSYSLSYPESKTIEHITHPETQEEYKYCKKCTEWMKIDKFGNSKGTRDGLYHCCKGCVSKGQRSKRQRM